MGCGGGGRMNTQPCSLSLLGDLGRCNIRILGREGARQTWKKEPEMGKGGIHQQGGPR